MQNSCHDVASNHFATNAPDPPHWTLNSCFGAFRTILVHLEQFGCLTKLVAKQAEQVQKFVPRSSFRIFRNERTRSTPLDPKMTFWWVSFYWVHFRNKRTRSTQSDPKLMFWCVSYYLGAFGTVCLPYETRCKTCQISAKVRATKSRRNFSQRTHPIHPIGH